MAEVTRSSVFAAIEETTEGEYIEPTAGSFIPLRDGFTFASNLELIESDEFVNDIGQTAPAVSKETPTGTLPKYVRHSDIEGQAPEWSVFMKSAMGTQTDNATEFDTIGGSSAGTASAAAFVIVDSGEGVNFVKGQALLIKDSNRSVRNITAISSDTLTLNYNLDSAPALGVDLGKAIHFQPAATGHISFTSHWFHSDDTATSAFHQAMVGCKTTNLAFNFTANEFAEVAIDWEGTGFNFNPLTVLEGVNDDIDFTVTGPSVEAAVITAKTYNNPHDLAREIASKMNSAQAVDVISVSYSDTTGKFTIATDGSLLSLLWKTGASGADNTDTHIGTLIGYSDAADDTSATTYDSDTAQDLAPQVTPAFDTAENLVMKNQELFIGDFNDNFCRNAVSAEFIITTTKTDADDLCSSTGIESSVLSERTATFTATLILQQFEAQLFDNHINNTTTQLMFNAGQKSAGNFTEGTVVNIFYPQTKITAIPVSDSDGFVVVNIEATGFVTGTDKDVHVNFL